MHSMTGRERALLVLAGQKPDHLPFMPITMESSALFGAAQIDAGADIIGVGDAAASLVGSRIYKVLIWPWEKRLVDAIHAKGAKVRLHICGNTRRILGSIVEFGCDSVDIYFPVPLELASTQMG